MRACIPFKFQESFLHGLDHALQKMGINIDAMHTEYSPGQLEISCEPQFGIVTADQTFMFREAVKLFSNQLIREFRGSVERTPPLDHFLHFHAVFREILNRNRLAPSPEVL